MKLPKDWKRTGMRTGIGVGIPLMAYFGLDAIQESLPISETHWLVARDVVEVGKDILAPVLANKFIGNIAKGDNNDADGNPIDHFGSDALDSLVKGLSIGVGAVLVSGDIASSDTIMQASKGVSDFLSDVHGKIDQYIFWAAAAYGSIREYFPSSKSE
jgi:hypothetical protein